MFHETVQSTYTFDALKCGVNEIVDEKIVSNKHYEKLNFFYRLLRANTVQACKIVLKR